MFKITKEHHDAIKQVCKVAPAKSPLQALQNVHVMAEKGSVTFKAGDSVCEITRTIETEVKSGVTFCVDAAKFSAAIQACGDCDVIVKDDVTIKAGRRKFTLQSIDPEAYPAYPDMEKSTKAKIDAQTLIQKINMVAFSAAQNDVRHILNGVYIGDVVAATNAHRATWAQLGLKQSAIVDIAAINKIPDIQGEVYLSSNILSIESDSVKFKCRLIDGKYPDIEKLWQEFDNSALVNRESLINAVKAAMITAHTQSRNITLSFGKECFITSTNEKRETSDIDFEAMTDKEFEMSFNSSYLLQLISALTSEQVKMYFSDQRLMVSQDGIKAVIQKVQL